MLSIAYPQLPSLYRKRSSTLMPGQPQAKDGRTVDSVLLLMWWWWWAASHQQSFRAHPMFPMFCASHNLQSGAHNPIRKSVSEMDGLPDHHRDDPGRTKLPGMEQL
eukprot:4982188-Amphidinium_carterae.1